MYAPPEKAKKIMESEGIDQALRSIFYEISSYPNWILNTDNSSGNSIKNIKSWCINIDEIKIQKITGYWIYPEIETEMEMVSAKINGVPFGFAGLSYIQAGFERIKILFYIRNKLMIDVLIDESYSQRLGNFGEILRVEEFHESREMKEVLIKLNNEVEEKSKRFLGEKNFDGNKFTFDD
jgi:hypothetical protein